MNPAFVTPEMDILDIHVPFRYYTARVSMQTWVLKSWFRFFQESKSRRIVNDLEGKEGLTPEPAINVVSDNPQMSEVLSSPELVQILCEIRNTGAIIANESLFSQFAAALDNSSSRNMLLGFDGPLDYLKEYRKNLIQEFFDTLKVEAEMRFFMAKDDPNLSFREQDTRSLPSDLPPDLGEGSQPTRRQSAVMDVGNVELWNKAVAEGLLKAQEQELKLHDKVEENVDSAWTLQRYMQDLDNLPPLFSDKAIGLLTIKYLEESRREIIKTPVSATTEPSATPNPEYKRIQAQKRKEFDNFVRHLISKIEILDEMGQHLLAFQRKRPTKHASLIDPLVKLLKKQSLFSSLTDTDLQLPAEELTDEHGSVKYFKVPPTPTREHVSRTTVPSMVSIAVDPSQNDICLQQRHVGGVSFLDAYHETNGNKICKEGCDLTEEEEIISAKHVHFLENKTIDGFPVCEIARCFEGSMRRAGCRACREKVKLACTRMQKRDALCSKTKDAYSWKIPEMSNWPHEYKDLPSGVRGRESVRSLSEIRRKEKMAKSVYFVPPPKSIKFQKGAPTPRFPRRTIPPDLSALSFRKQSLNLKDGQNLSLSETATAGSSRLLFGKSETLDTTAAALLSQTSVTRFPARRSSSRMSISGMRIKTGSSTSGTLGVGTKSSTVSDDVKKHLDSWSLRVSKMDIMRLRHELETETVKEKMAQFENKFLN